MSAVWPQPFPPPWASEWEDDAEWGLAATLVFKGVKQKFRWIPPGRFMMGSPEDEPERGYNELQHAVVLSRGYWLADTACTQALWQAVMSENPSLFEDDAQAPVEQVSWDDVQRFLTELNRQVPGLEAGLPTEAQWEYACRAGTEETKPFSFGMQITPEQVNYDGNNTYADGKKGEYRERTVAVKSLPPNAWGLYEMHGNVWELCADRYGAYRPEEQTDPSGPDRGVERVLRGGSWFSNGRACRSAHRYWGRPDVSVDSIGFRLAMALGQRDGGADEETGRSVDGQAQAERAGRATGGRAGRGAKRDAG